MRPETPQPPGGGLLLAPVTDQIRRIRLRLTVGAAIALIPWIAYLTLTLPENYVAHNWRATWVGFDASY